jgi:hypothetical protein
MERVDGFLRFLAVLIATIAAGASYELKDNVPFLKQMPIGVPIVVSIAIGALLPPVLVTVATKLRIARKLILGPAWLEGAWIVRTFNDSNEQIAVGLAQCDYPKSDLELRVTSFWEKGIRSGGETFANSDFVYVRATDLFYVSRLFSGRLGGPLIGVATGQFQRDTVRRRTTTYEGQIVFLDGQPPLRQTGKRLDAEVIKRAVKAHGDEWMRHVLRENSATPETAAVQENAHTNPPIAAESGVAGDGGARQGV